MEISFFTAVAISLMAVSVIAVAVVSGGVIHAYFETKREDLEIKREANQIAAKRRDYNLDYSTRMLDFIRTIIVQITSLHFNEFIDSHDISKVTEGQTKRLIDEIANTVHKSIDVNNINFDDALFDENFYNHFIIETVVDLVKHLIGKTVDKYIDG